MDINVIHDRIGHLSEPILRESARQHGITLTGRMEPCNSCLLARGERAPVAKRSGGRVERDLAPNDVLAVDMCGPFTPSLGGNLYMFYAWTTQRGTSSNTASVASARRWRCLSAVWWTWRTRRERR